MSRLCEQSNDGIRRTPLDVVRKFPDTVSDLQLISRTAPLPATVRSPVRSTFWGSAVTPLIVRLVSSDGGNTVGVPLKIVAATCQCPPLESDRFPKIVTGPGPFALPLAIVTLPFT